MDALSGLFFPQKSTFTLTCFYCISNWSYISSRVVPPWEKSTKNQENHQSNSVYHSIKHGALISGGIVHREGAACVLGLRPVDSDGAMDPFLFSCWAYSRKQELVSSDPFPFSSLFSLDNLPFISSPSHFLPAHSFFPLLLQCHSPWKRLQDLLHNIIITDACAYQAALYQTLSQPIAPMAIRLILVSFSRPAMAENWTVSPVVLYILQLWCQSRLRIIRPRIHGRRW